jgi:hypothetical protein
MVAKLPYSSANNLPCALFVAGKPVFYQLVKKNAGATTIAFPVANREGYPAAYYACSRKTGTQGEAVYP